MNEVRPLTEILILEPDEWLGKRMQEVLTRSGHHCERAETIAAGLTRVEKSERLLTLLNARLPWVESFQMLKALSARGWPVLFMTGDAANSAHLQALYQGSSAVLLSPFDGKALVHAVEELLRAADTTLTIGGLSLDVENRHATLDGQEVPLTAQEFALLQALMESPDAALSREQLLRTAWGYQGVGETRTVDVHVQRLRRKIGSTAIETVYKLGYKLRMA